MPEVKKFAFVCGQDDFLVGRTGSRLFAELTASGVDEFGREVIRGFAANRDEVDAAINRFREALLTMPMFGSRRVIWFKDINFLAKEKRDDEEKEERAEEEDEADDSIQPEDVLKKLLSLPIPPDTAVLVTAAPVDRRRSFIKWCEKNADFTLADGGGDEKAAAAVIAAEARALEATITPDAAALLLAKVGPDSRLLVEEVRKLAVFADNAIEESHVEEITANSADSEFFEPVERFFQGDLRAALDALRRHYFSGGNARPLLAALQNRNRLMIQLRALADAGEVEVGPGGVEGLPRASGTYGGRFGEAIGEKSSFNVFVQHPFYLGKVANRGRLPSLRRLIDNQREFLAAFEEIHRRPREQEEEVIREMIVRCLFSPKVS